jgi:signal transduction histidine kinase
LNTILLVNGLLRELLPSELTKARTKLDVIEESVTRSNRLIQDLLDVARMEAGKLELQREPLHAHKLVHHAVEMHRALAQEKRIELIADVPSNLHQVFADHDRVHQIFGNLIGNALKFTPEGGRVKVTVVERTELREVQFSVADTGPGIPKEAHARLFEAFWQAGKKKGGAGLGLSIARHIAEAHGGRIWAETEEGRGSTFHFTLPFTAADQAKVA